MKLPSFWSLSALITSMFIHFTVCSQDADRLIHYGKKEGLQDNNSKYIIQDNSGMLFLASFNGVTLFDGKQFRVMTIADGLDLTGTVRLFKSPKGRIWALSSAQTLSYYENGNFHALPKHINQKIAQIGYIEQMLFDNENNIYLESLRRPIRFGYLKRHKGKWSVTVSEEPPNIINTYSLDGFGSKRFMFMTEKFASARKDSIEFTFHFPNHPDFDTILRYKLGSPLVTGRIQIGDSILTNVGNYLYWLSPETGIHLIKRLSFFSFKFIQGSKNKLWVQSIGNPPLHFDLKTMQTDPEPLRILDNSYISYIYTDLEGGTWFAHDRGISYLPPQPFKRIPHNPKKSFITGILYFHDTLYRGYESGVLTYSIPKKGIKETVLDSFIEPSMAYLPSLKAIRIRGPYLYFLVGSSGLYRYHIRQRRSERLVKFPIASYALFPDNSIMFQALMHNISIWKDGKITEIKTTSESEFIKEVRGIVKWKNGTFLLATSNGIRLLDHGKIKKISNAFYANEAALGIVKIRDEVVAVSTAGAGMVVFRGNDTLVLNQQNGLSSNSIVSFSIDSKDRLWISTNSGVNRVTIDYSDFTLKELRFINGALLSDYTIDFVLEIEDEIMLSSIAGLNIIPANQISSSIRISPVTLEGISLNGEALKGNLISFLWGNDQRLQFSFRSITFLPGSRIKYFYRLTPKNTIWNSTYNQEAAFTDLPPGEYDFEIYALNEDNNMRTPVMRKHVSIFPQWYQQLWFKFAMIVLSLLIIYLTILQLYRRREQKLKLQETLLRMKQEALNAKLNPHFIFNALNSIQNFIAKNEAMESTRYLSKFAKLVRLVLDSSSRELVSLEDEIQLVEYYLELEQLRFRDRLKYSIEVDPQINPIKTQVPIFLLQPYAENAVWHGLNLKQQDGYVKVHIRQDKNQLICTITDNGIGREKASEIRRKQNPDHQSQGLQINENRLQLMAKLYQQDIRIAIEDLKNEDGSAAGTKVMIFLTIKNNNGVPN